MTNTQRIALSYIIGLTVFLSLDFVWLSLTSSRLYQPFLSAHLALQYDWKAVALFYPLYVAGIIFFAVRPLHDDAALRATTRGILFGVVAYATYDLTNQATFSGWPWVLTFIDMLWGGCATGCAAGIVRTILNRTLRR